MSNRDVSLKIKTNVNAWDPASHKKEGVFKQKDPVENLSAEKPQDSKKQAEAKEFLKKQQVCGCTKACTNHHTVVLPFF